MKTPPALHNHNFISSGKFRFYPAGHLSPAGQLEACNRCGMPFDEHPDHPGRHVNPFLPLDDPQDRDNS